MKDFLGYEVHVGDVVTYAAVTYKRVKQQLYIVTHISDAEHARDVEVRLRGFQRSYSPHKIETYVRRVYSPERIIRVNNTLFLDKFNDPVVRGLLEYKQKYYPTITPLPL